MIKALKVAIWVALLLAGLLMVAQAETLVWAASAGLLLVAASVCGLVVTARR